MAVALAENHDYLSRLRNELRDVMKNSPLCDAHLVTSKIENAYRTILATGPTHAR